MPPIFVTLAALVLAAACHTGRARGPSADSPAAARPEANSAADTEALAGFVTQLKGYAELHNKLEKMLPPVPNETTPEVMDKHQRALAQLLEQNRKQAKRGDLFTPAGERAIRRILDEVFSGPDGAQFKSTIMDENPSTVKLAINGRHSDDVPLSTMPAQLLARLPRLPEELEYRFIGPRLILLDAHSRTVADYIENILPQ